MSELVLDVTKLRFVDGEPDMHSETGVFVCKVNKLAADHGVNIKRIAFHFDSDEVTFFGDTVKLACLILDFESDLSIAIGLIRSIKE